MPARPTSGVCASETLGSALSYKDMLDRDAIGCGDGGSVAWTGGLTEGRKIAAMAETYHQPVSPQDCIGPVGFVAAVHMSFSQPNTLIQESVRAFYRGWYNGARHHVPDDPGRLLSIRWRGRASASICCRPCSTAPT